MGGMDVGWFKQDGKRSSARLATPSAGRADIKFVSLVKKYLPGQPAMRHVPIALGLVAMAANAQAIQIVVDYTFDTNDFFNSATPNGQQARSALEAAASRYSGIITSSLGAVGPADSGGGWRIGFSHPGTGAGLEISTSASSVADPLVPLGAGAADHYGFAGLAQDNWILYAGGRDLSTPGVGGTGTGTNLTSVFDDLNGPMHRGLIPNTPANSVNDLPVWGGSIAFDTNGVDWHFDHTKAASGASLDFYSIALHEIGHALGLSTGWNQWRQLQSGSTFTGQNAVAAYNADNGASAAALNQVSATNGHFEDGTYDSFIFAGADPNLVGTVGEGVLQDLLMEPTANFSPAVRRFELTNVDVGALGDVGWSLVPLPPAAWLMGTALLGLMGLVRRRTAMRD